jgi:hypothetical protein
MNRQAFSAWNFKKTWKLTQDLGRQMMVVMMMQMGSVLICSDVHGRQDVID